MAEGAFTHRTSQLLGSVGADHRKEANSLNVVHLPSNQKFWFKSSCSAVFELLPQEASAYLEHPVILPLAVSDAISWRTRKI